MMQLLEPTSHIRREKILFLIEEPENLAKVSLGIIHSWDIFP